MRWLVSLVAALPAGLADGLARFTFWLLYHAVGYRRATVDENLAHAFPERSAPERAQIARRFYEHLANLFIEILQSTRMSLEDFEDRVRFTNVDVLREATEDFERQALIMLIHQGNWEWMLHGATAHLPVAVDPVYKPLHSPFWDRFMLEARSRFGATPMTIDSVGREVIRGRKRKRLIVMLADQAGPKHGGFWSGFLHRPASFYRGADKLAQALKIPVLFARCRRRARGRYEVEFLPLSLPPHPSDGEQILRDYIAMAEQSIAEEPETYLWTNRRWKKTPPPDVQGKNSA